MKKEKFRKTNERNETRSNE